MTRDCGLFTNNKVAQKNCYARSHAALVHTYPTNDNETCVHTMIIKTLPAFYFCDIWLMFLERRLLQSYHDVDTMKRIHCGLRVEPFQRLGIVIIQVAFKMKSRITQELDEL
jgi:hypothetical protein